MATVTRHGIGYKELEAATGIPSTTARRYAKRFPTFLPCRVVDRSARFKPDAVGTFKRIHELFTAGSRADEIAEILAAEVPQVHDVAGPVATVATAATGSEAAALLPMLERLTLAVETLAAAQVETVALLKEMREKPQGRVADASGDKDQGEGQPGNENALETPWWRLWLRRLVG